MRMPRILTMAVVFIMLSAEASCMPIPSKRNSMSTDDLDQIWAESSGSNREQDAGVRPLYQAIVDQDYQKVEQLLGSGFSANDLLHKQAYSPLMVALSLSDRKMVELLLKNGANLNYVSDDIIYTTPLAVALSTAMHEAAAQGADAADYKNFWFLIDSGADINLEFQGGDIAIYAATMGQDALVNQLLQKGYRRDLSHLLRTINIRVVDDRTQPEKDKAIATITRLIKESDRAL